eukprot:jgi/Bigna1/145719/aug1.102_g20427
MQVMEDFVSLAQQLAGFQNKITKEATDRLIVAAESGDLEEVKLAIQMKANPNARDERKTYSWDPLHDPVCGGEACGMVKCSR